MIVYQHRRLDTNEIFYIGIGKTEKRAYHKRGRNSHWKNIVNKVGYSVEIVCTCSDWNEACDIERYLIKYYGRCDLGTGTLCNLTDGGDGALGFKHSEEAKKKISEIQKNRDPDIVRRIIESRNGYTHSAETRRKISEAQRGEKHHRAKRVINTETGVIYPTITEAAEKEGFKRSTLEMMLGGQNPNKSNLKKI